MPRGNKRIKEYGYSTDRTEPLTGRLNLRVTKDMEAKIKAIPNHPELIRVLLQEWLEGFADKDIRE